jgi:hypothetical protein
VKRSRQIVLILVTCGFIAVVVTVIWPEKPEPMYNGRSLSEWEEIYKRLLQSDMLGDREIALSLEAVKAAHEMRDSIIPVALKDIQCETPAWPRQMADKIERSHYLSRWCPNSLWMLLLEDRGEDGAIYFRMLGPDASPAVPDLERIMNQTKSAQIRERAMSALGEIGQDGLKSLMGALANPRFPSQEKAVYAIGISIDKGALASPAVPMLVKNLTNSNDKISIAATRVLGRLALEPESVVPALTNCMQSTNRDRRIAALIALEGFKGKAPSAIPSVKQALNDPDEIVRYFATNALETFAPDIVVTNGL